MNKFLKGGFSVAFGASLALCLGTAALAAELNTRASASTGSDTGTDANANASANTIKPYLTSQNMGRTAPRTTRSAEYFSVESASRCFIRFDEQDLITTVSFKNKAFQLKSSLASDPLPRFMVTGYTFKSLPVDKALYKLVHEAGIQIIAPAGVYPIVSGKDLKGELASVVDKLTKTAGVFYAYDATKKYLRIERTGKWKLSLPNSREIMLAVLDTLRGSGVRDITPDWENKTIAFSGSSEVERKVEKLVHDFDDGTSIVAYDIALYRVTPSIAGGSINWQRLVDRFGTNSIRSSTKGLLGRMLISTDGEISYYDFVNFVKGQGDVALVSNGTLMVPENWRSRFDIGRCGNIRQPEATLSVLAGALVEKGRTISGSLALDTTKGEVTNFPSFQTEIGDSILIFGIPSSILGVAPKGSEIAMVITPKVVRLVKESSFAR